MHEVTFGTDSRHFAALGQGTWKMGVSPSQSAAEIASLEMGIDHGLRVIDTAAMYADGDSEKVVGRATVNQREKVYIISKVWPSKADYPGVLSSLEESLQRLQTTYLDLFLLHWPSAKFPVSGTMKAMREAYGKGWIHGVGVSNFTVALMEEAQEVLQDVPLTANQVEYSLTAREAETSVIPYCQSHRITTIAYSPIKHITPLPEGHPGMQALRKFAAVYHSTPQSVALAWVIQHPQVIAIPKTSNIEHLRSNMDALNITLSHSHLALLDKVFPPSGRDLSIQKI
jgi:diketogulonate reductase-like aldo/keto reductase